MLTKNKNVLNWIDDITYLCKPKNVVWIDGSKKQIEKICLDSVNSGEISPLNPETFPNCFIHRTAVNDVARVEDKTFICTKNKKDVGITNNWWKSSDAYKKLSSLFNGVMSDRTLYVIPYLMGPPSSPFSKVGIEITDSSYVVLNMNIMTRIGQLALDNLGDTSNDFVRGLHSKASIDENNRYICHFPEENTIWSINSGYGGNVLLGKKCFALRIASYQGKLESWMAEHMLILGVESPDGDITYFAAAFPSACGKTNLAMLIPPEIYKNKGYKIWCVGDDIAWLRKGEDGRLWAINPENGFFGVAPGTSQKSNPNALKCTKSNTIFTNVVHDLDNNSVWWEGMETPPPTNALDWKGNPWTSQNLEKGAHPNSRFTSPAYNCPSISKEFNNPHGVPISGIIFGGRRKKLAPLVYQSYDWNHGVFIGATISSETTAAATGQTGIVRRDPMAMIPFCGYDIGEYFSHWINIGDSLGANAPKIFHVNWFRTDDNGNFIWPGFGENMRVLLWILNRCNNSDSPAKKTPIGFVPNIEDIDISGLDISTKCLTDILHIDKDLWLSEISSIQDFFLSIGKSLPIELSKQLEDLKSRLEE